MTDLLEITITHNLHDAAEVAELFHLELIALDWDRLGPDPNAYSGRGRTDIRMFHSMRQTGAAVIAAYKGATQSRSHRLVGLIKPNEDFQRLNGLLCLKISNAKVVDSSASFLGNLPPRQCTIQSCSSRAKGRLAAFVLGQPSPRSVWSLHNRDVETLVTNYLTTQNICTHVWSGTRAFEDIDHAGFMSNGKELLAQTTVSAKLVANKAEKLLQLAQVNRSLHFFGPADARKYCPESIQYHAIEDIFFELDRTNGGRWLIDRMLNLNGSSA